MTQTNAENVSKELVSVMVPVDRLTEVYALLGSPKGFHEERNPNLMVSSSKITKDVHQYFRPVESRDWPESLLQLAYNESSPAMKTVLDVLIEKAGETVHSHELVAALSRHRNEECTHLTLAGTIGAFGRRVSNRYQREDWPMYSFWDSSANEVQYRMDPEVAAKMRPPTN